MVEYSIEVIQTHLQVEVSGSFEQESLVQLFTDIADTARVSDCPRVLLDVRGFNYHQSMDPYRLGERYGHLVMGLRLAVLRREDVTTDFFRYAMRRLGVDCENFYDPACAVRWLERAV